MLSRYMIIIYIDRMSSFILLHVHLGGFIIIPLIQILIAEVAMEDQGQYNCEADVQGASNPTLLNPPMLQFCSKCKGMFLLLTVSHQ